jgi:hypothetical protein
MPTLVIDELQAAHYIRTLAEDLARRRAAAHLAALRAPAAASSTWGHHTEALQALSEASDAMPLLPPDVLVVDWPACTCTTTKRGVFTGLRRASPGRRAGWVSGVSARPSLPRTRRSAFSALPTSPQAS